MDQSLVIQVDMYSGSGQFLETAQKMIYDVYKYIDTDQAEEYTQFALDYIGISDWSEVIEMQEDQDSSGPDQG